MHRSEKLGPERRGRSACIDLSAEAQAERLKALGSLAPRAGYFLLGRYD